MSGYITNKLKIRFSDIVLFIASCLFSIIVTEITLRLFYHPTPIICGWRSNVPKSDQNQLGFRGKPIHYSDDDYIVILLGDSQAEADACPYAGMPERYLEHHLNSEGKRVQVFTLGTNGYGQDQQLLVLEEYYRLYKADLVVLWLTPGNDIWNNIFPTHWPANGAPKPTFWLEKGKLKGPNMKMGQDVYSSPLKLISLLKRNFHHPDRDKEWEKYLPEPYTPMTEYDGLVNDLWQDIWNKNLGASHDENLNNEKSHNSIMLTPRSKRMQYGLGLTRELMKKIKKLVTSHNGKFVVFRITTPSIYSVSGEEVFVLNGKFYKTSNEQYESNINYICKDFEAYAIPVTIEEWRVSPADTHLNENAVNQVMHSLAGKLKTYIPDYKNFNAGNH